VRIAQIAPLYESVPPEAYGGTERVIAALCDGLTALGHDVTLFAADSSQTDATLESYGPPLRRRMTYDELSGVAPHLHLRLLDDVYQQADRFDVVHSHVDVWTLPFIHRAETPTVVTMHGRLDIDQVRRVLPLYPDVAIVSISDDQRQPLAPFDIRWAATVYNGLDLSSYASNGVARGEHLAFLGRICPEKRPDLAIETARRTGRPLQIAAKVDPADVEYHQTVIEPLLGDDVEFLGEIDEALKASFLAGAAATLFPSDWPEPFGLVMIESMAAGTPVIALRRGSVPEVVADGLSGFICDGVDDMVDAVRRLDEVDAEACRRQAARFDAAAMCEGYERVYGSLLGEPAAALQLEI
jgi:glycosyltransferase involved in cell wall biosynthesis